jgi:hypothetical protein
MTAANRCHIVSRPPNLGIGLSAAVLLAAIAYTGYRLDRARHELEWYKKTFGYRTPTVGVTGCVCQNPRWRGLLIDADIVYTDGAHNIEPFDIDGDGNLELVANSYRSDTLLVYKPAGDPAGAREWTRYVVDAQVGGGIPRHPAASYAKAALKRDLIDNYVEGAHYTAIADLSGDGVADFVVAGDLMRYDVTWYQTVAGMRRQMPSWTKHALYENDAHRTYHVETGDLDGDGDRDIVFTTKTDNSLGWLENRGPYCPWPVRTLDANCVRCFYARAVDLNGDGRAEVVASEDDTPRGGRLHLYTCSGAPGRAGSWKRYDIARLPPGHGISVFALRDLDGDGNCDIAAANHQGDICVLRNPGAQLVTQPWDMYLVTANGSHQGRDFREIDVGDIDLDGNPDIVVADEGQNAVVWYENPGATFCSGWREQVVDQSAVYLRWCHCVRLADLDGDGDLDIAVAAAASNTFLLYWNQVRPDGGLPAVHTASGPRWGGPAGGVLPGG